MPKPSYIDGMYPLVGRPKYPSLWRGCVGAWAPCLGPSGLTLHDWGGFGRHGTLTNMDTADWVISGGQTALDFDNTDDYVNCGTSSLYNFTTQFSVSIWFRTFSVGDYVVFISRYNATAGWFAGVYLSKVFLQVNGTFTSAGATPTANTWTHFAGTWDGSTLRAFMNAGTPDTVAFSASPSVSASLLIGAYSTTAIAPMNGQLDDVRLYNRALTLSEISLLASRRGIAYEVAERTIDPGTNRRRRVLIGA